MNMIEETKEAIPLRPILQALANKDFYGYVSTDLYGNVRIRIPGVESFVEHLIEPFVKGDSND